MTSVMVQPATAQKLKLPSLLPFKKQKREVQPVQLSDQAKHQFRMFPEKPLFNLFSVPRGSKSLLDDLNDRSKQFWSSAGQNFSSFAQDTRQVLESSRRKFEAQPWVPFTPSWTERLSNFENTFPWSAWSKQEPALPPLRPKYRMSHGPATRPRHRF